MTPMPAIDTPLPHPDRPPGGSSGGASAAGQLAGLESLLCRWIGLDVATIGSASIARACQRRLAASGLSDLAALESLVLRDPAERDRLVEEVVVSESWFFRDEQVFVFLESFARARVGLTDRLPLRILSVPCACGEEPYSIAMRLIDAGMPPDSFVIDAFDVSHACLARARAGRYSANAFRNADQTFRRRWFRDEGTAAVIDPAVRSRVRFAWGNLLDPTFAEREPPYDVIFCRNLLIYLTEEARRRVETTLARLLAADGALVLGAAEPPIMRGGWIPAGMSSMFALRKAVAPPSKTGSRPAADRSSPASSWQSLPPRGDRTAPSPTAVFRRPAPARPAATASVQPAVNAHSDQLAETLQRAGELANASRHADAIAACEAHARHLGPSPELFFMLGSLHQAHGDLDRAEGYFHKTLYLDPTHEEAALALALVAGCRGDERMAESYRESASRIFSRKAGQ
jgi:chemotaxis protein methyltransferase WspC